MLVDAAEGLLAAKGSEADREALARAIRAVALEHLKARASASLAEDLAQSTTLRVLRAFEGGCTTPERLPAYTTAAARNEHASHRRKASSQREDLTDTIDETPQREPVVTPEQELAEVQEAQIDGERLRSLIAVMPVAYRDAITRHYLKECPIDVLVEEEITVRLHGAGRSPDDVVARDGARLNARRTVDQRLSRGRSWLALRLAVPGGDV